MGRCIGQDHVERLSGDQGVVGQWERKHQSPKGDADIPTLVVFTPPIGKISPEKGAKHPGGAGYHAHEHTDFRHCESVVSYEQ